MVSFNSAGREGRPALALRIVHTGCTAGGLEHPRVVLVGLVFPASLLPVGQCFALRGWTDPRSRFRLKERESPRFLDGSRAGWETRSLILEFRLVGPRGGPVKQNSSNGTRSDPEV